MSQPPGSGKDDPDSTIGGLADSPRSSRSRWLHRAGVTLLTLFVAAGAVGLLGPREGVVRASADGYDLEVEHAAISRAGVPAPLHLRVTREGGFSGPVQIALCDDWFDHQDFQSWYPTSSSEVGEADQLVYEFDPPAGNTLEVSLDAHTAPGNFGGRDSCSIEILENDAPVAGVEFTTWRLP